MRNLRVFGISDIPFTTIKLNATVHCFFFFSLTVALSSSLKTKIHCPKVTDKHMSNPSGNKNLPGNLLATSIYRLVKYPRDNEPLAITVPEFVHPL